MLIASAVDGPLAAPTTSTPYSGADYTNGVLVTVPVNTNVADTSSAAVAKLSAIVAAFIKSFTARFNALALVIGKIQRKLHIK